MNPYEHNAGKTREKPGRNPRKTRHSDLAELLESDATSGQWLRRVQRKHSLSAGQPLYRDGDACGSVYYVHAGCLKLMRGDAEGHEHISRFLTQGEVAGIEGLEHGRHIETAHALCKTDVWEVPYEELQQAMAVSRAVREALCRVASRGQRMLLRALWRLGTLSAEGRLADFLLAYAESAVDGETDARSFLLPMPRCDIANYLGMNTETVSRLISSFSRQRIIAVQGRKVRILDPEGVHAVISGRGRHRHAPGADLVSTAPTPAAPLELGKEDACTYLSGTTIDSPSR